MKTVNFNMDLMVPSQVNKDVIFNESLLMIDCFMQMSVVNFTDSTPENIEVGQKYIITDGDYVNHICYLSYSSKEVEYLKPQNGMIIFIVENNHFVIYNGQQWEPVILNESSSSYSSNSSSSSSYSSSSNSSSSFPKIVDNKFTAIDGITRIRENKSNFYLYLSNDAELNLDEIQTAEITFVIKQSANATHSLQWPNNILWENKEPHEMTRTINSTDLIKLYRLPESNHFLGKIIAQNFQF